MKLNSYKIVNDAIESGIEFGLQRSRKHTSKPSDDKIVEEIVNAVMLNLAEIIIFDDQELIITKHKSK